jgi:transcriptional regulator of acetoin/glycerol metabolism
VQLKDLRAQHRAEEGRFIASILENARGNVAEAARAAGINRQYLHKLIARHRLKPKCNGRQRGGNAAWRALA